MLNITSLRVYKETDIRYRKNLSTDKPYVFNNTLPEDFFAKNISIHAIVGKNGSGKSTLLEIMMRLVNNLGYFLKYDTNITDEHNYLCYIFNLHAEISYTKDGIAGSLACNDDTIKLTYGDKKVYERESKRAAGFKIRAVNSEAKDDLSNFQKIANEFFYTVCINYGMFSYNCFDFLGEENKGFNNYGKSTFRVADVWINHLFPNNDDFLTPLVIEPNRENGKIDLAIEETFIQSRIEALIIYYKLYNKDYIEGYKFHKIDYHYNPACVTAFFDDAHLKRLLDEFKSMFDSKDLKFLYEHNFHVSYSRANYLIKILSNNLLSKGYVTLPHIVLDSFGITITNKDSNYARIAQLYLVCEVFNIINSRPTFDAEKMKLIHCYGEYLGPNSRFDINDIFTLRTDNDYFVKEIRNIVDIVKERIDGTFGLELRRILNFLKRNGNRQENFEIQDSLILYYKDLITDGECPTPSSVSSRLPPCFFDREIILRKKFKNGDYGEPESFDKLSSGERQFIFTTSTLVYHLQNLQNTVPPQPRYPACNVIFDEIEICFHPEYQREFIAKVLRLLTRLELNKDCSIHIFIATHSPFILSDIPQQNILYLKDGEPVPEGEIKINPFAANINEILAQSFFLKDGFMGRFAQEKINKAVSLLRGKKMLSKKQQADIEFLISQIGEPIIKNSLIALLESRRNDA